MNWRPLTLLNTDYKIIAKVLANRLQTVLAILIGQEQSAYVKGRNLVDNVRSVIDIINEQNSHRRNAYIIFVDFKKAFDSISHKFLRKCLKHMGMGKFVDYVMALYNNIESCVTHNGHISNFFRIEQGLRQGCPLSALLFIVVINALTLSIKHDAEIKGLKVAQKEFKINLHADDIVLYALDPNSCHNLFRTLLHFERVSGLAVNREKTEAFSLNKATPLNLGIKWNPEFFRYLGVHLSRIMSKAEVHNKENAIKIYRASLDQWANRKLTLEGKETVINSQALSKILHLLLPFFITDDELKKFDDLTRKFLWGKGIDQVAYCHMAKKVEDGGYFIPLPSCRIKSLKSRWLVKCKPSNTHAWYAKLNSISPIPIDVLVSGSAKGNWYKTNNRFWDSIINSWLAMNRKDYARDIAHISSLGLWHNHLIEFNNTSLFSQVQ